MTEKQQQIAAHNRATAAFIDLANTLSKEDDQDPKIVSAALMAASGVYATFIAAGNDGYLGAGGVDKVAGLYKNNLSYIQQRKRDELKAQGKVAKPIGQAGETVDAPHADAIKKAHEHDD
ncbi:MAG: DUF3144 domain-containing protein [Pseudomonadota bacterium]